MLRRSRPSRKCGPEPAENSLCAVAGRSGIDYPAFTMPTPVMKRLTLARGRAVDGRRSAMFSLAAPISCPKGIWPARGAKILFVSPEATKPKTAASCAGLVAMAIGGCSPHLFSLTACKSKGGIP